MRHVFTIAMPHYFLIVFSLCLLAACQGRQSEEEKAVESALAAFAEQPSDSTAEVVAQSVRMYVDVHGMQDSTAARYVIKAARAQGARNRIPEALEFYRTWLLAYPDRPDQADKLAEVIALVEPAQSAEINQLLYKAFVLRFPEDARADKFSASITDSPADIDSVLRTLRTGIFNEETFRYDEARAQGYIRAVELTAMAHPTLPEIPMHLHVAAESARTIRQYDKAIALFDWLHTQYPGDPIAARALFLKGFVIDTDLKDFPRAGEVYEDFIARYPDHELAESARYLIQHLGMTEEELGRMLDTIRPPQ